MISPRMLDAQTTQQDEVVRQKVRTKDKAGARVALLKKQQIVKQSTNLDNQILALENQVGIFFSLPQSQTYLLEKLLHNRRLICWVLPSWTPLASTIACIAG